MQICMTKELYEAAQFKPVRQKGDDPMVRWSGKLTKIADKESLILCHDRTRFTCFIYDVNDLSRDALEKLIYEGLQRSLLDLGISKVLVDRYLQGSGEVVFTTIKGQTYSNRLDKAEEEIVKRKQFITPDTQFQSLITNIINSTAVIAKRGEGKKYPYTSMTKVLEETQEESELEFHTAYTLFVQLELKGLDSWRKVMVPGSITFRQLHYVMQILFDYDNNHMFEFLVQGMFSYYRVQPRSDNAFRIFDLFDADEPESDTDLTLEQTMEIIDDLTMFYRYDFGADWMHRIRVQKTQVSEPVTFPVLMFGFIQKLPDFVNPYDLSLIGFFDDDDEDEDLEEDDELEDDELQSEEDEDDQIDGDAYDLEDDEEESPLTYFDEMMVEIKLESCMDKGYHAGIFGTY